MRASTTQPTFDLLTGAEIPKGGNLPPSRGPPSRAMTPTNDDEMRALGASTSSIPVSTAAASASEINELKAEVKALKYKISSTAQEEELAALGRDAELRDIRRKAEDDFKARQGAEGEKKKIERQLVEVKRELEQMREGGGEERQKLERNLRQAEEARRLAEEEVEDVRAEAEERVRIFERQMNEEKSRNAALQQTVQELQTEADEREQALRNSQSRVQEKEREIGTLETEVLRLKAATGDVDTLDIIKRELADQVDHIRTLETAKREQARELEHLRMLHKSVEIVEEEKRQLQRKVDTMEDLQQELGEARLQRQRLEDERLAWTAYLQTQSGDENGAVEFDSPEDIANALIKERYEAATLLEKVGRLEPAVSECEETIKNLENEKEALATELEKAKQEAVNTEAKDALARAERERALAVKEVEYLREQVKAMDKEEVTMELPSFDEAKAQRISQLEEMVTSYSTEVQKLQGELATKAKVEGAPVTRKRAREEEEPSERVGELTRKNRKLQDELTSAQNSAKLLNKELKAAQKQLKAAQEHKQVRILQLRDNPTSNVEAIKQSTLEALKEENEALLTQLRDGPLPGRGERSKVVPISTLDAKERDLQEMQRLVVSTRKSMERLKQVWGAKTAEFREGISSLLGWKVEFMPNGKMKVTSLFYESTDDEERSIVFDGEKGTMKVSGGPKSKFAEKIAAHIGFWVRERGEIPCLLAALTLEFYEEGQQGKETS